MLKAFEADSVRYRKDCNTYGYLLFLYLAQQARMVDELGKKPENILIEDDKNLIGQIGALLIEETIE